MDKWTNRQLVHTNKMERADHHGDGDGNDTNQPADPEAAAAPHPAHISAKVF